MFFMSVVRSSNPLPASESLLFGATARSVAAVATIPFTVVKTRYEVRERQRICML